MMIKYIYNTIRKEPAAMENPTVTLRYPDFYPAFRCIGPACSDNCCHSWPIEIDKSHYLAYRRQKHPEFAALCGKYLHRTKKDATDRCYARLSLKEDGRCGFQDEDGGCRIIRQLGESWLSDTCNFYPRRKHVFSPGIWELSLAMSCEEMVRLGVLREEEIVFQTEKRPLSESDPLHALSATGIGPKGAVTPPPAWGDTLRTVCIKLMQLHDVSLQERLAAMLLLMRKLDALLAAGREDMILGETLRFLQGLEQGSIARFLNALDENPQARLAALQLSMGHILAGRAGAASEDFLRTLSLHLEGDASTGYRAGRAALTERIRADSRPQAHEMWLENYFVNYMFSCMFPFGNRGGGYSFTDHALLLLHQYGILRCLLATSPETDARKCFTKAMVHTARLSQHGDFRGDFRKLLETFGLREPMAMLYLLK